MNILKPSYYLVLLLIHPITIATIEAMNGSKTKTVSIAHTDCIGALSKLYPHAFLSSAKDCPLTRSFEEEIVTATSMGIAQKKGASPKTALSTAQHSATTVNNLPLTDAFWFTREAARILNEEKQAGVYVSYAWLQTLRFIETTLLFEPFANWKIQDVVNIVTSLSRLTQKNPGLFRNNTDDRYSRLRSPTKEESALLKPLLKELLTRKKWDASFEDMVGVHPAGIFYKHPEPDDIANLLERCLNETKEALLAFHYEKNESLRKANCVRIGATFIYTIACIRPFKGAHKRLAHIMINLLLFQNGFEPLPITNRAGFTSAIRESLATQNPLALITFFEKMYAIKSHPTYTPPAHKAAEKSQVPESTQALTRSEEEDDDAKDADDRNNRSTRGQPTLFSIAHAASLRDKISEIKGKPYNAYLSVTLSDGTSSLTNIKDLPHSRNDGNVCRHCKKTNPRFTCKNCKAGYCDTICQKLDWPAHKSPCKKMKDLLNAMSFHN